MVRVMVVGGGTAGSESALEAAAMGAEVTVVERSEQPSPPWKHWPDLIRPEVGSRPAHSSGPRRAWSSSARSLVAEVNSVGPGFAILSGGRRHTFDLAILATGCSMEPCGLRRSDMPGVLFLNSPGDYAELGRSVATEGEVVVAGEGSRGLQVAERLSRNDRTIRLFASHWQSGEPSPPILRVLEDEAAERGILLARGTVSRAMGACPLEAGVVGDRVFACALLAVVPRRLPRVIPSRALTGRHGGLAVDWRMKTTAHGVYAAGGCAELLPGIPPSSVLDGEAAISGRIAGSSCMGGGRTAGPFRTREMVVFGLRWTRAGTTAHPGAWPGLQRAEVGKRWARSSACSILFEGPAQRVIGVETLEPADEPPAGPLSMAYAPSLAALANGGLGSSDISVVSDTARLGLRNCRRS